MGLARLKEEYEKLQKKHNLPSFREMNEDFYIEKIAENETEIPLREIRRAIGEKFDNYLRFIESLLNPVNVPMFIFSIIKLIGPEEKKKLSEIYKKMVQNEINFIERDLKFEEAKEAGFIRKSYELWQGIKKELADILEKVEKNLGNKTEENTKGYFG